tara:strand:- start:5066 stop:5344 length:279 start_codon:yes stop_codon:yes gene_type:complete
LRSLSSKYKKKGTPRQEVTIPTGSSEGIIRVLANVSALPTRNAPVRADIASKTGAKYITGSMNYGSPAKVYGLNNGTDRFFYREFSIAQPSD